MISIVISLLLITTVSARTYTIALSRPCDYLASRTDAKANVVTFQNAMNKIGTDKGGILRIKSGTYLLNKYIEMPSNIQVIGDGMTLTTLKLADKSPSFIYGNSKKSGFLRNRAGSNIILRDFTLDGNKLKQNTDSKSQYGRYGVFTEGSKNLVFDRVKVMNWQAYGFDPHGWKDAPGGPLYGNNIIITNCIAQNNDWDGFTLDQSNGYRVENCQSLNNGRHGYNFCTGTINSIGKNNYASGNGFVLSGLGFHTSTRACNVNIVNNQEYGTGKITITGNTLRDAKNAGICLNDVYSIVLSNNKIYANPNAHKYATNPYNCMYFEKVRSSSVLNNQCQRNSVFDKRKSPSGITYTGNTFNLV
jgi:parallel beta-helix repeat protein